MIISQGLIQAAMKNVGHPSVYEFGKVISYGNLKKNVAQLSYLYQTEIPQGENVGIYGANSTAAIQTFFALSNIGNPVVFFDPSESEESLCRDIVNLQIKHLLVSSSQLAKVRDLLRSRGISLTLTEFEKKRGGEFDASFTPSPDRQVKETDAALISRVDEYGSDRKYIFISHKKLYSGTMSLRKFYRLMPNDRMLGQVSWSHPFGLVHGMLLPLFLGSTCVIDPQSSSVEEFVEFIAKAGVTRFSGPPKFYLQLLSYCASQKYTLPGVKSITVGMGTLSLTLRKTYKLLNIPILRSYGRLESIWPIAMDAVEEALDIETAKSKPVAGMKCKVMDANGDEIPGPGPRIGLLAVTSDFVMDSYWQPDKEEAAMATRNAIRGTWFYTQDVARLEGEGAETTIAVLGAAKDMLFQENTYLSPREIDAAAAGIPGVTEAAGFVRVDSTGVRSFACAVVPEGRGLSEAAVLQELRGRLPRGYAVSSVHFVEAIPVGAFGSVNRQALQRQFF